MVSDHHHDERLSFAQYSATHGLRVRVAKAQFLRLDHAAKDEAAKLLRATANVRARTTCDHVRAEAPNTSPDTCAVVFGRSVGLASTSLMTGVLVGACSDATPRPRTLRSVRI